MWFHENTMKSSLMMDSKYHSEGRHGLPRRRVATKTLENGDSNFEMELSLAIKESLRYAKEKEGQLKRVDKTSPLLNGVQSDESFTKMAGKVLTFATSNDQGQGSEVEVQQLKDLLLIHIELIQHQQELIANKDKEIRTLRNEKETLQFQLHKAEKRVVQLKQKEDLLETEIANAKDIAVAATAFAEPPPAVMPGLTKKTVKAEPTSHRKRRQKQVKTPKSLKVRKLADTDRASSSGTSDQQADSDLSEESESIDEDEEESRGTSSKAVENKTEEAETDGEDEDFEDGEKVIKDPHPEPVLRTDCLYHMSCCVEVPPDDMDVMEEKEVVIGDKISVAVETPCWRINILTNRYQLEGTENITDEAYQKRHQKHEMEEKRRKRWDVQRMREQRVFEKLRGKEQAEATAAQNLQTPRTFLPDIENLTHVEVSETVPVMVFGQPVPHVEPSEFELPWDTGPSSSFTRRSHGGRGRHK